MGYLSDMWDFDKYALKELWGAIEDDPERLLFGSIDPLSTELWNGILGRDDEPMINQLGGPMGGGSTGLGSGGVYDDYVADGGSIEGMRNARKAHDVAEVVAGIFGTMGAAEGLGSAFGGGGEAGAGSGFSWQDFGTNLMKNPPQMGGPQQAPQQTPQHVFNQQQLAPLMAPQNEQEAQARNNAMSLLLQQHRG